MKQNRFWFGLIALCVAVACTAAIVLAIVSATTALAVTNPEDTSSLISPQEPSPIGAAQESPETPRVETERPRSFRGLVTDTSCKAKHLNQDKTAAECAKICVQHGAHYALAAGEKLYLLAGDPSQFNRLAGQRAEVIGSLEGNLVTVRSIKTAEQ
jgi:hypothetical protein